MIDDTFVTSIKQEKGKKLELSISTKNVNDTLTFILVNASGKAKITSSNYPSNRYSIVTRVDQ